MKKMLFLVGTCIVALVVAQAGSQTGPPVLAGTSSGGWQAIGPEGGNIQSMMLHPTNPNEITAMIAGYPAAVYKTTNGGQSWQRIAFINDTIYDIDYDPLNPNILYAPAFSRLWKSTNGGGTWSSSNYQSSFFFSGNLAVHPSSSNILYGCGYYYSGGNYSIAFAKSADAGATWTTKSISSVSSWAQAFVLAISPGNPNIIYLSGYFSAGGNYINKLYKSSDGGVNWQDVTGIIGTDYRIEGLAVDPNNANRVYAGTDWAIWRSSDGGATWTKNSGFAFGYSLAVDRNNPNTIYSGYIKEVYKSTDGGINWARSSGMFGTCSTILASNTNVYFGSNAGVYRSFNAGVSWQEANSGIKASNIAAVGASTASPNIVYCEVSGLGFFRSLNYGSSWTRCPDFYRCENISRILTGPTNPNEVFILAGG